MNTPNHDVHDLTLPWPRPPLSANDRLHWHIRARIIADIRATVGWLARAEQIGRHHRIRVTLTWTPTHRRRRDSDNLAPTLKAAIDGLVDAGVIPDDTDEHVERAPTVITAPTAAAAQLQLRIEPLERARRHRAAPPPADPPPANPT